MKNYIHWIVFVLAMLQNAGLAQMDSVQYTFEYELNDGVYGTYDEFKTDNPRIKKDVIILNNSSLEKFFGLWTSPDVAYINDDGDIEKVDKFSVWGFCDGGIVFIRHHDYFFRINELGSIFMFSVPKYPPKTSFSRFDRGKQIKRLIVYETTGKNLIKSHHQFIVDHKSGMRYKLNLYNFSQLLRKRDIDLYNEFVAIGSKRKRQKAIFIYMQKYNDRNPIYF